MSDGEVAAHRLIRVRDGRWSPLTRALKERFGVEKLDLNMDWAATWQRWECPCCGRQKAEIARVSGDGVLLCKLVWHHDHIDVLVKAMLRRADDPNVPDEKRAARQLARTLVFPLLERFTATLVCEDCNNADGDMKAVLGGDVDRAFSFSPNEIRSFIRVRANERHELDPEAGKLAWREVEPAFRDRVTFARVLVERVNAGLHDRERHGAPTEAAFSAPSMLYSLATDRAAPRSNLSGMGDALLARSRSTDGHAITAGKKARRGVVVPTSGACQRVCTANATSRTWVRAKDDWRCPICNRSKFEITRMGNRGEFGAKIHELRRFYLEQEPESLAWRRLSYDLPLVIGAHRSIAVCQDCRSVVTEAGRVVPGTNQDDLCPSDIAALIGEPRAHCRHELDNNELRKTIAGNADWSVAAKDYWAHYQEAINAYSSVSTLLRQLSLEDAKLTVYSRYRVGLDQTDSDLWHRFDWLLHEGERLEAFNRKM